MIKLDIGSIPEGSSEVDLTVDAVELGEPPEDVSFETPVEIRLTADRNGNDVFLSGTAALGVALECARCLEHYSLVLKAPIRVWCIIGTGGEETEIGERDNVIQVPPDRRWADLAGHVRSELLVLVPLKPLCSAGCKGLCPTCGVNLNVDSCSCSDDTHDSRWDALNKIK